MAQEPFEYSREELQEKSDTLTDYYEPKRDSIIKEVDNEDPDFFDYTWDAIASAPEGAARAIENTDDFLQRHVLKVGYFKLTNDKGQFDFGYITRSEVTDEMLDKRMLPTIHTPETGLGEFTAGMTQFLTGFIGPQKYLKGVGLGGSLLKTGARGMTAGAVADLLVWDPNEKRLADWLVESDSPWLNNVVTQYLQTESTDTYFEARLKNVLEGAFLGSAAELLIALKGIKNIRTIKDLDEKAKVSEEIGESIEEVIADKKASNLETLNKIRRPKGSDGDLDTKLKELDEASKAGDKAEVVSLSTEINTIVKAMRAVIDTKSGSAKKAAAEVESKYITRKDTKTKEWKVINKENDKVLHTSKSKAEVIKVAKAFNTEEGLIDRLKRYRSNLETLNKIRRPKGSDGDLDTKLKELKELDEVIADRKASNLETLNKLRTPKPKTVKDINKLDDESTDINKPNKKVIKALTEDVEAINTERLLDDLDIDLDKPLESLSKIIKESVDISKIRSSGEALHIIDLIVKSFGRRHKEILNNGKLKIQVAKELGELLALDYNVLLRGLDQTVDNLNNSLFVYLATKSVLQSMTDALSIMLKKHDKLFVKDVDLIDGLKRDANKNPPKDYTQSRIELLKLMKLFNDVHTKERLIASKFGKGLRLVKEDMPGGKGLTDDLTQNTLDMLNTMNSYMNDPDALARAMRHKSGPKAIVEAIRKPKIRRILDAAQSVFINNLLVRISTHAINTMGNANELFLKPLGVMLGGSVGAIYHAAAGNHVAQKEYIQAIQLGFARWQGMQLFSKELWDNVGTAFRTADPVLDTKLRTQDNLTIKDGRQISPISAEAFYMRPGTGATAVDWIGNFIEFPGRMLVTGDEIFKQLNYRGKVYSNALENTFNRGLDPSSKEGLANIKKITDNAFDANGRANLDPPGGLFKNEYESALEYARETTFQLELKGGENFYDIGGSIEKFVNSNPLLRFVVPFIRTPTNLWRNFETHIPGLGLMAKRMKTLAASGPQGKADVIGRQILGTTAVVTAWSFMNDIVALPNGSRVPRMTGRGPSDYKTRKLWYATGWQPYSFLIKNSDGEYVYRTYNRMDPRFFMFGMIADLREASSLHPDADFFQQSSHILTGIMINIGDKSYTRGIGDVLKLMNDADSTNEKDYSRFFGKVAANFVPYSPFIKSFQNDTKALRNFSDKFYDSLTYGFGEAEDKLDVFGEPIGKNLNTIYMNPSWMSLVFQGPFLLGREAKVAQGKTYKDRHGRDEIDDQAWLYTIKQLSVIGKLTLAPPRQKLNTLDLSEYTFKPGRRSKKGDPEEGTTAIHYWHSTMSTVRIRKMTLREALKELIESRDFSRLKISSGADAEDFKGGKEEAIEELYREYKLEAKELMLEKYPQIQTDLDNREDAQDSQLDYMTGRERREQEVKDKTNERKIIDKLIDY